MRWERSYRPHAPRFYGNDSWQAELRGYQFMRRSMRHARQVCGRDSVSAARRCKPASHRSAMRIALSRTHRLGSVLLSEFRGRTLYGHQGAANAVDPGKLSLVAVAVILFLSVSCSPTPPSAPPPETPQRPADNSVSTSEPADAQAMLDLGPFQIPLADNPGYLGFAACRECHAERVAECETTPHFQTCRYPTTDRMPRRFFSANPADRTFVVPGTSIRFEMNYTDGQFTQTASQGTPPLGSQTTSTIDLVYGAKNTSDEVYLSWHPDGQMRELPVGWVDAHQAWGAAGFDRLGGGDFGRELTVRCFECHNTWFQHVPGTLGTYTPGHLLAGVTCERCHGPAQEHVQFHRDHPTAVDTRGIVYPGGLSRDRLLDVCLQCHSNAIRHRGPALSFRPGDDLSDHYRYVHPKFEEDDHVADQISDLKESACFLHSDMTCVTCHDPHRTSQPAQQLSYREICLQCHAAPACQQHAEIPQPVSGRCTDCHMRKYVKINVNFDLESDSYVPPLERSKHRIAVDPIGTQEVLLEWYEAQGDSASAARAETLREEILAYWLDQASQIAASGRHLGAIAAVREALRIAPQHAAARARLQEYIEMRRKWDDLWTVAEHARRDGRLPAARDAFEQIIAINPLDALAYGRLGTIHYQQGDVDRAVELWQKCGQLNPDEQYGVSMQAWAALQRGDPQRAAQLYAVANEIEPFNSKLNTLWAQALIASGNLDQARQRLEVALQSDPRNLDAGRLIVATLLRMGRTQAAVEFAENCVRLTEHKDIDDLMTLAEVYLQLERRAEARQAAQRALSIAVIQRLGVAQEIRQWMASTLASP
ncbi:MAG: tetratricopeptide repeat protein [Planctomycetota bacterium]|nr:MAG: tetratricopeptide repeat protein [Planctomycetota bacterium]